MHFRSFRQVFILILVDESHGRPWCDSGSGIARIEDNDFHRNRNTDERHEKRRPVTGRSYNNSRENEKHSDNPLTK